MSFRRPHGGPGLKLMLVSACLILAVLLVVYSRANEPALVTATTKLLSMVSTALAGPAAISGVAVWLLLAGASLWSVIVILRAWRVMRWLRSYKGHGASPVYQEVLELARATMDAAGFLTFILPVLGFTGTAVGMLVSFSTGSLGGNGATVAAGIGTAIETTVAGLLGLIPVSFTLYRLQHALAEEASDAEDSPDRAPAARPNESLAHLATPPSIHVVEVTPSALNDRVMDQAGRLQHASD